MDLENCIFGLHTLRSAYLHSRQGCANQELVTEEVQTAKKISLGFAQLTRTISAASVSRKQQLLRWKAEAVALKLQFKSLLTSDGQLARRDTSKDRVRWEDIPTLDTQIRNGVIVNIKHANILNFMSDALVLFEPRVKNALKVDNAIKVNTVLACYAC